MQLLYTALFGLHALVGATVALSMLTTLTSSAVRPGLKPGELFAAVLIVLVLSATGFWAWTLRSTGRLGAAVLVLAAVWSCVVAAVFIAASTVRWN